MQCLTYIFETPSLSDVKINLEILLSCFYQVFQENSGVVPERKEAVSVHMRSSSSFIIVSIATGIWQRIWVNGVTPVPKCKDTEDVGNWSKAPHFRNLGTLSRFCLKRLGNEQR
jgi:hypothetical protein